MAFRFDVELLDGITDFLDSLDEKLVKKSFIK